MGVWPLATPPSELTAAQTMVLAEAFTDRSKDKAGKTPLHKAQPRVPKSVLKQIAKRSDPTVRTGDDDI